MKENDSLAVEVTRSSINCGRCGATGELLSGDDCPQCEGSGEIGMDVISVE